MKRPLTTAAAAALLLVPGPGWARERDWMYVRDAFLEPTRRNELMRDCALGRQYNSYGESFWEPSRLDRRRTALTIGAQRMPDVSPAFIEAFLLGHAAAMAVVCPDVR